MGYYEQKAKYAYSLYLKNEPFKKVYAAVKKDDKYVCLQLKKKGDKFSLSGGGVDPGEDNITAIKREILEELNINIKILKSLGKIHYIRTWHYEGKDFDVDYDAEIFLTEFVSYGDNGKIGIEGEFNSGDVKIVEISKETMLKEVAEFKDFHLKLD